MKKLGIGCAGLLALMFMLSAIGTCLSAAEQKRAAKEERAELAALRANAPKMLEPLILRVKRLVEAGDDFDAVDTLERELLPIVDTPYAMEWWAARPDPKATTLELHLQSVVAPARQRIALANQAAAAEVARRAEEAARQMEEAARRAAEARRVKESCKAVARKFGLESDLTDLQKKEEWKKYRGKSFAWEMSVMEVSETFGQLTVQTKCKGSTAFVSDMIMRVPKEKRDLALQLKLKHRYTFFGELDDRSGILMSLSGDLTGVQ